MIYMCFVVIYVIVMFEIGYRGCLYVVCINSIIYSGKLSTFIVSII